MPASALRHLVPQSHLKAGQEARTKPGGFCRSKLQHFRGLVPQPRSHHRPPPLRGQPSSSQTRCVRSRLQHSRAQRSNSLHQRRLDRAERLPGEQQSSRKRLRSHLQRLAKGVLRGLPSLNPARARTHRREGPNHEDQVRVSFRHSRLRRWAAEHQLERRRKTTRPFRLPQRPCEKKQPRSQLHHVWTRTRPGQTRWASIFSLCPRSRPGRLAPCVFWHLRWPASAYRRRRRRAGSC